MSKLFFFFRKRHKACQILDFLVQFVCRVYTCVQDGSHPYEKFKQTSHLHFPFYILGSPSTRGTTDDVAQEWNLRQDCSKDIRSIKQRHLQTDLSLKLVKQQEKNCLANRLIANTTLLCITTNNKSNCTNLKLTQASFMGSSSTVHGN